MFNRNENGKKLQNNDEITAYPHRMNIAFIKYFDVKYISDSIDELNKKKHHRT